MSTWDDDLPPLDTHAHIAPDVTPEQLLALGRVQVFAMTRSLLEAAAVLDRVDQAVTWACGTHPGSAEALEVFTRDRLAGLLPRFAVVGEIGLDARSPHRDRQAAVFDQTLSVAAGQQVLLSIHSSGAVDAVLDSLSRWRPPGAILHWFRGSPSQVSRAAALGCYFSVNAATTAEVIRRLPIDRVVPETDFPSSARRGGGHRPGDTTGLEALAAEAWSVDAAEARTRFYRNLRNVAAGSGAIERLPDDLADLLVAA